MIGHCYFLFNVLVLLTYYTYSFHISRHTWTQSKIQDIKGSYITSSSKSKTFEQSYIDQKNYIILEKLQKASANGNLTDTANSFVNFCDQSFDNFLQEYISSLPTEDEKQKLGKIRYEINSARQRKLREADKILRGILQAGALKPMEAKLMYHLKRNEIDMAFMVILQLNIEDAMTAKSEVAGQIMTHLRTIITEYQDNMVTPPVRLMRLLIRTDEPEIRREILRQKLLVDEELKKAYYAKQEVTIDPVGATCCSGSGSSSSSSSSSSCNNDNSQSHDHNHNHDHHDSSMEVTILQQKKIEMETLANAQCEHIVIEDTSSLSSSTSTSHTDATAMDHEHSHEHSHEHNHDHSGVKSYGPADVDVQSLIDTIVDVQMQVFKLSHCRQL